MSNSNWQDDVRREYEEFKKRFRNTSYDDFKTGKWFFELVRWMLSKYASSVDADYIRRKYPGAGPANQAKKAITLASRINAIAGGASAATITALELSSAGPQAIITVPAVTATVCGDVAFSTRTQLRTTYDLSVIWGAPLLIDDVEDCYLVLLNALGIKLSELTGAIWKPIGPGIIKYNVRKLLRTGLRKAIQNILQKVGGGRLAKILTERAVMRLLVPGISIPISAGFNYYFTRQILRVANIQMERRSAVIQPLIRLYKRETKLPKTFGPKLLIVIANIGDPEGWSERQMDCLRHCQSALSLTDAQLTELETYFDYTIDDLAMEVPKGFSQGVDDLIDLSVVQAAFADEDRYDDKYGKAIAKLSNYCNSRLTMREAKEKIKMKRQRLR